VVLKTFPVPSSTPLNVPLLQLIEPITKFLLLKNSVLKHFIFTPSPMELVQFGGVEIELINILGSLDEY